MSFSTLISGTHKKTSQPSASSSRPSVRSSRPSVSSSRRAARNNDISESNDDNRAIILKIYEKLNKLETDFADMKKGQSGMETDIKKIKNEICLLMNDKKFMESVNLIAEGIISSNLHYGAYARNWWVQKTSKSEEKQKSQHLLVPYRLYMRVSCELNGEQFILSVVQSLLNPLQPGFVCFCKEKSTKVLTSASVAINILYQELFGRKTEYSGPIVMGLYNEQIVAKLVRDIIFYPIFIFVHSFLIVVSNIGYSENNEFYGAVNGFSSSILTRFRGKQSLISQKIKDNMCILEVYHEAEIIVQYKDKTPSGVWKKIDINRKFNGSDLFGITHQTVQDILQQPPNDFHIVQMCTPNEWNNFDILQQVFDRHIKSRKITTAVLLDWKKLFDDWLSQNSTIIQLPKILQKIYPINYQFQDKDICAWKAMFKACGCTNVTPFKKNISNIEFWSRALNPNGDKETLINLYNAGLIQLEKRKENFFEVINNSEIFWESFRMALKNNKRGIDGKIRILSIIADKFCYKDLREKLQII
ncbi:hypothetical protein Glove_329g90 [Diversispora epigaea]|uniref:Uncharacterized protein n=1 Tax=Diversispora epigaea TaxID=1348612 RepID=A0A397HKE2_9GLOM|nr:hypothetical protein Glove_329g90 [Diversispora epigaea]